ncbi:hypothetical protein P170DRAFT_459100 [Aspergillus steynii IBT 23096]|uniref:Uncharacterized protein n=1 Tax=Aspergillus steynii IBT 23096 TaxID=1392250 RepID=A0A2I2FVE3_9EURO|nr:uncharacterized protein P170DRAFT_459100 [Aspergillus steynii IBT 23096]PLB44594.1 hypothetical protein P170DRAFT_459100 [Aspergillus steynii IBT 23096]
MSGMGKVFKEGWHPKSREGGKESWRGDFKGINQVAGWMGKGKDKDSEREEHVSRPLSTLKDPSAFGPPPKHVKYHGAAALPNETTPDRRGLGAPLSQEQIDYQKEQEQAEIQAQEQEAQKPAPPPLPYRANRTGVDPSVLPPPPVRRMGSPAEPSVPTNTRPKPSVPPRIPPRTNSTPVSHPPSPPPAYSPSAAETPSDPYINQAATSRLAQSGFSVPALGIGNGGNQWQSPGASPAPTGSVGQAPLNELQSRFSQMRTNSQREAPSPPPARGTYASEQSQSPAPASDTRSAQSTVNDFREKHSDKIDAGKQKLSGLNEKYGISQRVNGFFDDKKSSQGNSGPPPPLPRHPKAVQPPPSASSESLGQRKAPPPPPPKKSGMRSTPVPASAPTPPPIPLGTKPR